MESNEFYAQSVEAVLTQLNASKEGLSQEMSVERLNEYGRNELPRAVLPGIPKIFFSQFLNPLIYVLLFAAVVSIFIGDVTDAIFVCIVLFVNALVGTWQEYSAQQSASSLAHMVPNHVTVIREKKAVLMDAVQLVPGDIINLESGDKIPADARLLWENDLTIDESLLTGESDVVTKDSNIILSSCRTLSDRLNTVFAGSMVTRGRGQAVVTETGASTQIGHIAQAIHMAHEETPLMIRMKAFTTRITVVMLALITIIFVAGLYNGMAVGEVFLMASALAVAAIPEGLPIALTVTLAIGMRRMAKRNVVIRKLTAVESLGSCTVIASDKTGTLTVNKMTVKSIVFPDGSDVPIAGEGVAIRGYECTASERENPMFSCLSLHSVLTNEASLSTDGDDPTYNGDMVDVAFLVVAEKLGVNRQSLSNEYHRLASIAYESHNRYSADLHVKEGVPYISVKGSVGALLPMCSKMMTAGGDVALNHDVVRKQSDQLARQGYRVLAVVGGQCPANKDGLKEEDLTGLTFLGMVGMIDPLRPEAKDSVSACQSAGVDVRMVTGDNALTAFAIAKQLGFCADQQQVITGSELKDAKASDPSLFDELVLKSKVFARVEPLQKQEIVASLSKQGHFVAATGDGVNDAPALKDAHVGVAMGKGGTDIARESADIIITDDNFSSIVSGIEEGRVVYNNIRKVIAFLLSTNSAEILLFIFCLLAGLPMPLLAVQILWLNLVTEGIQHIALASEGPEGRELEVPPRDKSELIFDGIMIRRIIFSSLIMSTISFLFFKWMLSSGYDIDSARNSVLLLLVLFENFKVLNNRSETVSVLKQSLWRNPLVIIGIVAAQGLHVAAMYTPWLADILHIHPIPLEWWLILISVAVMLLVLGEVQKALRF